jgi:hypothetical protein
MSLKLQDKEFIALTPKVYALKRKRLSTKEIAMKLKVPIEKVRAAIAIRTDKWTEIIFRALTAKVANRWRFVSFRGKKKRDARGVVDVVAIRKDASDPGKVPLKAYDLFELILIQMKGGSANTPNLRDRRRLQAVAKRYFGAKVVLYKWVKGEKSEFSVLMDDLKWDVQPRSEIFG